MGEPFHQLGPELFTVNESSSLRTNFTGHFVVTNTSGKDVSKIKRQKVLEEIHKGHGLKLKFEITGPGYLPKIIEAKIKPTYMTFINTKF